jgi:uncharacterized RDD family membrane protein YckC
MARWRLHRVQGDYMTGNAAAQLDSTVRVVTPENIAFRYQLAGPCRRLGAFVIDSIIQLAVFIPSLIGVSLLGSDFALGIFLISVFVAWSSYGAIFETYMNGQTPGKKAFRLRVLSVDGQPIDGMKAFIRNLLRGADLLPPAGGTMFPTCMVGLVAMSLNGRFQRLGDIVAGTMVVAEERQWLMGLETLEDPRVYQLASYIPDSFQISRGLSRTLAMYVERRRFFGPARRTEIAQPLCQPLLDQFGLPPDTSYDLLLCALYYRAFVGDRSEDEQYAEVAAQALEKKRKDSQPFRQSQGRDLSSPGRPFA